LQIENHLLNALLRREENVEHLIIKDSEGIPLGGSEQSDGLDGDEDDVSEDVSDSDEDMASAGPIEEEH
jgi:hypothetical protein